MKASHVVGFLLGAVLLFAVVAVPVWLLWNQLIPGIFGVRAVSYPEAMGLLVLSSLLFRSGCVGYRK